MLAFLVLFLTRSGSSGRWYSVCAVGVARSMSHSCTWADKAYAVSRSRVR